MYVCVLNTKFSFKFNMCVYIQNYIKIKLGFLKSELSCLHPAAFNLHPYFKIKSLWVSILSVLSVWSFPWLRDTAPAQHSGWLLSISLKQLVGTSHWTINPAVQSHFLTLASHFKTDVTRACHIVNPISEGRCLSPLLKKL